MPTPITPRRVGRLRTSRRSTSAASFRYGSESNIPVVPCVRPSHGSETWAANGRPPSRSSSARRLAHEQPDLPVARCGSRGRPACRRRRAPRPASRGSGTGRAPIFAGSQPMPAFCESPKTSPDGRSRRNSGVSGSSARPGPSAVGLDRRETDSAASLLSCTGRARGRSRTRPRSARAWRRRSGRSSAGRSRRPPSRRRGSARPPSRTASASASWSRCSLKPPNRQTRSPMRCFASARSTSPDERLEVSVSIASGPGVGHVLEQQRRAAAVVEADEVAGVVRGLHALRLVRLHELDGSGRGRRRRRPRSRSSRSSGCRSRPGAGRSPSASRCRRASGRARTAGRS